MNSGFGNDVGVEAVAEVNRVDVVAGNEVSTIFLLKGLAKSWAVGIS